MLHVRQIFQHVIQELLGLEKKFQSHVANKLSKSFPSSPLQQENNTYFDKEIFQSVSLNKTMLIMSTTICQNKQNVYQFDKNQFEYSLFDLQTTTKTSSLKVSFLNGIQEQRSLIRQLQVKRVQGFWLALVGRENKSPKNKNPNLQKTLTVNFQCLNNNHPKKKRKEKKRREKKRSFLSFS